MTTPYILVTYDNNMPVQHADVVRECKTTLAILDKDGRPRTGLTEEQYWRDVIHRHAHRFVEQEAQTIWRYRCTNRPLPFKLPPAATATV